MARASHLFCLMMCLIPTYYMATRICIASNESGWLLFVAAVCFAVQPIAIVAIYRLCFHPLAVYPGPAFAAITDWYNIYHCMTGDRHLEFYRLHREYGPIVRFGPNRLSFNSSTALSAIYHGQANTRKSKVYSAFSHFFTVPATMTTIDRKKHSFKRRVTLQALTTRAIKNLESKILRNVDKLCQSIGGSSADWGESRNISTLISYLLSDIMGDVTFSRSWDVQDCADNRFIIDLLPVGTGCINMSGHMPILLKLKLDKIFFPSLVAGTERFRSICQDQSDWRMQFRDSLSNDLFTSLLEARDPDSGRGYTDEELIAEAGILIIAGSDTTATSLTATLFYLLHNSPALRKAEEEVHSVFSGIGEIRIGSRLSSCRYLLACIDEAMRMSPAVGAILPREVLDGGLIVDGEYLPEGVDVGVPIYALHHSEQHFESPFEYNPERWLEDENSDAKAAVARAKEAFCPFGVGRTSCVGKYLAYQEMSMILARLIFSFEMQLQPGTHLGEGSASYSAYGRQRPTEFQLYDHFVSTHDGPQVQFKPRI